MEKKQIVLKLFTQALGVDGAIDDLASRKAFQKAVLLGQSLSGIDLGYRFNWYLYGPYSPALANDYYMMAEAIEFGDKEYENHSLIDSVRKRLGRIRGLFDVPKEMTLEKPDWLELVGSWYYLRSVCKYDEERVLATITRKKPHLAPYVPAAKQALRPFEPQG